MESFSKLKGSGDGEDRISNLPDNILTHILSLISTRYAVATSVLSSRWRDVWTTIDSFDFDEYDAVTIGLRTEGNDYAQGFPRFLEGVLQRCDAINIYNLRLCYHGKDLGLVQYCVLYAVSRNVQELELDVLCGRGLELPCEFFTCRSLRKLKVKIDYLFNIPSLVNSFPQLKSLHIQFKYSDLNFCRVLLSSCPQLQDLLIDPGPCYWRKLQNEISNTSGLNQIKYALDSMLVSPASCFQNLVRLEVTIDNFVVRIWLPVFLKASPNLNILILQMEHEKEADKYRKPYDWPQHIHEEVPLCLLQRLGEIRIKSFQDRGVERNVVKFLLDSADVLQKLAINVLKPHIRRKVSKWILKLPRASSRCQIEVV